MVKGVYQESEKDGQCLLGVVLDIRVKCCWEDWL